jgi:hypothetical protein
MERKSEDSFFQIDDNYGNFHKKLTNNIHCKNKRSEIISTEDIFIKLKEEIETIKKKQSEIKMLRESYKTKTNLKYIHVKRDKNLNTYNTSNTLLSNKTDNQMTKSNSINNKCFKAKRRKYLSSNIKDIKLDLKNDYNINKGLYNNTNENNNSYTDNDIINNSSKNLIIKNFDEDDIDFLSLSNNEWFEKCECGIKGKDENNCDENYLPIINEKWKNIYDMANFDFSKNVLKTKNIIDYNTKGVEINIHLKLFGQSSFFIFTRCYVDDSIELDNDNSIDSIKKCKSQRVYDIKRRKNNSLFTKYSTVIKIYKSNNSNKAFVSFGTFYKNKKNGTLEYKTFLQRQLVDYLHEDNNYYYLENDLCEFDIIIIDMGYENLVSKISLNNKEKYNIIKSNFFLPINSKAQLMFCGEGKSAKVMSLNIRSFDKYDDTEKVGLLISAEKKDCDCCLIQ